MTPESEANLPRHIAVIMDGNNRWAKARDLPSIAGHRAGAEAANAIVDIIADNSITADQGTPMIVWKIFMYIFNLEDQINGEKINWSDIG